jgi:hypothetical protein
MGHFRLKLTTSVASALITSALSASNSNAVVLPYTDEIYPLANHEDGAGGAFLRWYYQSRGGDGTYRETSIAQGSPTLCESPTDELPDVTRGGFGASAECSTAAVRE